ncbi:MAG: hypothetical protein NT159_13615 [Proteobacteria bacterium]|nr:hypothetical protein [Pseudomonadota bacterium]
MLRQALAGKPELSDDDLNNLLRLLAKWRHALISNTLIARQGNVVQSGPFAGLRFIGQTSEGCSAPRLLGCYEHELHLHLERLIGQSFDAVLNIGCADGYYAVGLAQRMPNAKIIAHDLNPAAQTNCREVAELNGVVDRVQVGGLFEGADFAVFAGKKIWLVMDIEGGERELLDPVSYPALRSMTVLVECHDCFVPGMSVEIARRFADSHAITRVDHTLTATPLPEWLQGLGHLDHLLAVWEWRMGPTPWLILEPKA